jgi:hypothetical protein
LGGEGRRTIQKAQDNSAIPTASATTARGRTSHQNIA